MFAPFQFVPALRMRSIYRFAWQGADRSRLHNSNHVTLCDGQRRYTSANEIDAPTGTLGVAFALLILGLLNI
jgi:hypothetical protein